MQTWFRRSPNSDAKKHRRHASRRKGHTRGKFLSAFAVEQLEHRVLLAADLAATKVSAPPTGPVVQGELVTYTVAITNIAGTSAATGVHFSDTLPAGLTFVSATGLPTGTLTASGNTVSGSLADLPAVTGADTVTIQATVNSTATGTIAGNTATVTDSAGDTATSAATAPLTVTALPATGTVDVSIAKTAANNNAPVNAGGSETYTITVKNNDTTTTAAGVTVIDALPAGATGVTGTNSAGAFTAPVGNVATETIGTLAPGATATISITLTAPPTPGAMVNAATVASTTPDRNLANNVATVVTPLSGTVGTTSVDLGVTKTAAPTSGTVGTNEVYTVVVTNHSTTAATGVTLIDTLPANATFVSATGPAGALTPIGTALTDAIGNLAAGASATVTVTVTPTTPGVIVNSAIVEGNELDTNQLNNTATVTTPVNGGVGTTAVDLGVTKTAAPTSGTVGTNEVYTIVVTNHSTGTGATGVTLVDTLPANATFVSATGPGGALTPVGPALTDSIGNLAAGASATVTVTVTPTTPGVVTNTAVVEGNELDTNQLNNTATVTTPVNGGVGTTAVDLGVTKTAAPTSGTVNTNEVYTIVVTNHSTGTAATGVTLVDTLPANATFVSATGPGGALTPVGTALTDSIGNLAAGASATVTVTVTPTTPGVVTNTAVVEGNELDTNQLNNVATVTTPINGGVGTTAVDLGVTKTAAPTSGTVGTNEVYSIVVTNHSTTAATGVTLVDTLPANATFVSATGPGGALTPVGTALTDSIGNLAAGASDTITVTVTPTTPGVIVNTAVVEGNELDTNQTNNVATVTTPVNGGVGTTSVDLGVTKTAAPTSGTVGTNEVYTIVVTNHSTTAATGVTLVDTLPANATFVSATGPGGALTPVGTALTDSIGNLAAGASDTITVTVTPTTPGVIVNTAVVEGNELDTNQTNNVATVTTPVNGGVGTTSVDLGVTKTAAPTTGTVGANEVYTIVVTNHSTTAATGVTLIDTLPANATFVSATGPGGALTPVGTALTDSIGNLAAGASDTITVTVTPTTPGVIANTAVVEGNELDTNQTNNVATVITPISGVTGTAVDLSVTKTAAPATGTVGTNEVYTIVVTNNSTSTAATGVTLVDTLPANATFVSATGGLTPTAGVLTDSIGNLAAGASDTISVTVTPTTPGVITNTAVVEGTQPDTNQLNNVATVVTPVQGGTTGGTVDVSVTKTAGTNPAVVGSNEVYTIVVTNAASSSATATGVTLIDTLPTNATFVSATGGLTPTAGVLTDTIGSLAAGASATITVTVKPTTGTVLVNTAVVAEDQVDTNYANNTATVSVPISTTVTGASLSISKIATPEPVSAGGQLTYTIVVNNSGTAAATGTVLTDTLPAGLTFVSAIDSTGITVSNNSGALTDNIGTLAAGGTDTITVVANVGSAFTPGQTVVNTASVSSPDFNGGAAITAQATSTIAGVTVPPGHICYVAGTPGDGTDATFVTNLYRELLGRDPDTGGFNGWVNFLQTGNGYGNGHNNGNNNGNASQRREDVIQGFLNSQEYKLHLVTCVYENFLGRAPDAGGLAFWVDKLGNPGQEGGPGGSRDLKFVVAAIAGSDEFYLRAGGTTQGWVDALYQDILGRGADGSGQSFWMSEAQHRNASDRDGIVRDLLNTSEAEHKLLNSTYPTLGTPSTLGAPGTSAGGTYALADLTGGGWENLYFNGPYDSAAGNNNGNANANDVFFAKLQGQTPWDDVIEDMLESDAYFNNQNQVGTLATGTSSTTLGTGGTP